MDKVINRYIREKFSTSVPYTINIELTQSCPLNCPECYQIKENSQEIEMSLFRSTISEAAAIGVSVILLSGGDPLMFSQIERAVEIVKMHNMICYLSSSGCGLTEELAHRLSRAGLDAFHVSLNGSTEQVNSLSRAGFEHAITALNILRSANLPSVINWVAFHENIHDFSNVIALATELGVSHVDVLMLKHGGNSTMTPCTMEDIEYLSTIIDPEDDFIRIEPCFVQLRLRIFGNRISRADKGCGAGRFHMTVLHNGEYKSCYHSMMSHRANSIMEFWQYNPEVRQFREEAGAISDAELCKGCKYSSRCMICKYTPERRLFDHCPAYLKRGEDGERVQ